MAAGGFYKLVRSLYVYVAETSPASPCCQPGPPRSLRVQACYCHAGAAWPGMAVAPVGSSGEVKKAARREGGGVGASVKACQQQNWPSCHYKSRMTDWQLSSRVGDADAEKKRGKNILD